MHTFQQEVIENTVNKLLHGENYRDEVINSINASFFDFCLDFFKKIVEAKFNNQSINLEWYKQNFINDKDLSTDEVIIHSGLNRKTVSNIYGTANREIAIKVANNNIEYLEELLSSIDDPNININIILEYNQVSVTLNLTESLIVINTLATKKLAIRGGAWSSIGKKVEKPLLDKLCLLTGVPNENINNQFFVKDKSKEFDREVDYKLYDINGKEYRIEVKLMGKGNPESADATIARETDIFVADTLSEQNKRQLTALNILYLELKDNTNVLTDFKEILTKLNIPYFDK